MRGRWPLSTRHAHTLLLRVRVQDLGLKGKAATTLVAEAPATLGIYIQALRWLAIHPGALVDHKDVLGTWTLEEVRVCRLCAAACACVCPLPSLPSLPLIPSLSSSQ